MEEVKYIPGDLVMTDGVPIGTNEGVVYVVTASDPNRTFTFKDGTVLKGVVTLDAITEEDKAHFVETSTWVKHIVPISLTPAILEDNGWEKSSLCLSYFKEYNKENQRICVFVDYQKSGRWYVEFNANKIYIQYYHQLQHLWFGLNLPSDLKV